MAIDEFCKQLVRSNPAAMAEWLLGVSGVDGYASSITPGFYWQLIDTELAAETQRADSVILHAGSATKPNQLLHLEFQSRPDRQMPEKMLEYWIRLWRLHGKPIHQVVLYLKKTNSPLVQVDELQVGETRHRYGVVRLWEQDPQPLLQNPALLPLATLARPTPEHLALVADRVAAIKNPVLQKEIAGGCHLLAGLGFSQELINAYFTMGILDDSVTYQAAVAEYTRRGRLEGEQRGRQQGLKEGERQGEERGLQLGHNQGLQQEAQSLVLRLLPRRCGQLSHEQELAVRALPLEKLEALAEALLDFDGPEALDAWLAV